MISKTTKPFLFVISVAIASASCGKKDSSDDSEEEAAIATDSVSELALSDALTIDVPDSVAAKGTSLLLAEEKKSSEACRIRSTVNEGIRAIQQVGSMFCHFEAESDKIEYGKKYNINFSSGSKQGAGSFQIWIDNSAKDAGKLTVYFCEDKKLKEKIIITGAKDGRAKGEMQSFGSSTEKGSTQKWGRSIKFDSGYSEEGRIVLMSKDKFSSGDNQAFRRLLALDLKKDGVSNLVVSEKGTWEGNTFENAGAALINEKHGMAVYVGSGTNNGEEYDFSSRAYFDSLGVKISATVSKGFSKSGELFVDDSIVPDFLPTDFSPDKFSSSDWDCSTDEKITLDPDSKAHKACEQGKDGFEQEDCWGEDYADGVSHEVKDGERTDAEKFDIDPSKEE